MSYTEKILGLLANKKKRVNWIFNEELYEKFKKSAKTEGKKPLRKIEELMIKYLEEKGQL